MKDIVVTLLSQKPCELSQFLKAYYNKDIILDEGAFKWSHFYTNPSETINLISTIMDNADTYKIETFLTLNKVATIKVTDENLDLLIRLFMCIP